jgi:hypothetical protein
MNKSIFEFETRPHPLRSSAFASCLNRDIRKCRSGECSVEYVRRRCRSLRHFRSHVSGTGLGSDPHPLGRERHVRRTLCARQRVHRLTQQLYGAQRELADDWLTIRKESSQACQLRERRLKSPLVAPCPCCSHDGRRHQARGSSLLPGRRRVDGP